MTLSREGEFCSPKEILDPNVARLLQPVIAPPDHVIDGDLDCPCVRHPAPYSYQT
ncbi:Hypothetical protein FKW44_005426 [Caligus rogercresseyi]|uniref:Uncharacterized protein n=1 Tax=Caligus rogercresseyi TaxID=217165 RepID=A0A7T8KBZ3_CALRO|nr:Hypothetical protein FKW44_005426 [Caligus rogercresseyi]